MGRQTQVQCTECWHKFRYELSWMEADGVVHCPVCGHSMRVPESQRAEIRRVLSEPPAGAGVAPTAGRA